MVELVARVFRGKVSLVALDNLSLLQTHLQVVEEGLLRLVHLALQLPEEKVETEYFRQLQGFLLPGLVEVEVALALRSHPLPVVWVELAVAEMDTVPIK
jgi:hypothetical protein